MSSIIKFFKIIFHIQYLKKKARYCITADRASVNKKILLPIYIFTVFPPCLTGCVFFGCLHLNYLFLILKQNNTDASLGPYVFAWYRADPAKNNTFSY